MLARILGCVSFSFLVALPVLAQNAPCGRTLVVVTETDKQKEERFLPAPPEHVKANAIRALPAVGAKLEDDKGLALKAKFDRNGVYKSWSDTNRKAGVRGSMAGTVWGTYLIDLRAESRNGVDGTNVTIAFSKFGIGGSEKGATQLMEEVACLSGLLSRVDPRTNPRGASDASEPGGSGNESVPLPAGTPLKVLLRDPLYSRDINKKEKSQVVFEVEEDVKVGGVLLVRTGALALGRITADAKGADMFGQSADLRFVVDNVTAVDGQSVPVVGAVARQTQRNIRTVGFNPFVIGFETVVRAGTSYDVEVSSPLTIKVGR
jgi:hypothetical protein